MAEHERMKYNKAREMQKKGQLGRKVLTERGWVLPLTPEELKAMEQQKKS